MGSRTNFELRHQTDGWWCYSYTSWSHDRADNASRAGGLTRLPPAFPTAAAGKAWVEEQFSVPVRSWRRRGGKWVASKGDSGQ
jgi:hypothetical protein